LPGDAWASPFRAQRYETTHQALRLEAVDPRAILVVVQIVIKSATMTSGRDMPGRASRAAI